MTNHAPAIPSTDEQYRLVYQAIVAVAARCDGAHEQDGVGFNGQDTKFGRRIASVPFEEWTDEIKAEAASIAPTYRKQIEAYTGIDVTALPVVQDATGSHVARDQARQIEKKAKARNGRVAVVLNEQVVQLTFSYDRDLVDAVRDLPNRKWDPAAKVWNVGHSQALVDFVEAHGFVLSGEIVVPEPAAEAAPAERKPNVVLDPAGVRISFPYDAGAVNGVRRLPGRRYDGATKTNTADLHPEVLAFADEFNFVVDPAVVEAIANLGASQAAAQTEAQIRRQVSALANPADLPSEFVQRVLAASPKAQVI